MKETWVDIKSAATTFLLAWLLILTPLFAVTTIVHIVNPAAFAESE